MKASNERVVAEVDGIVIEMTRDEAIEIRKQIAGPANRDFGAVGASFDLNYQLQKALGPDDPMSPYSSGPLA